MPPLPAEEEAGLTAKVDRRLAVRSAVKEVLTIMDGSQPQVHFPNRAAELFVRAADRRSAPGSSTMRGRDAARPVITGLAFRYRGSDRFVPDAPDARMTARRGRDPLTFREQTETLAAGESIVAVKCSSTATQFTSSPLRRVTAGSSFSARNGTIIPWGPPDVFSADGNRSSAS